jgi:hypothetical protein
MTPLMGVGKHDHQRMSKPLRKGAGDAAQSIGRVAVLEPIHRIASVDATGIAIDRGRL